MLVDCRSTRKGWRELLGGDFPAVPPPAVPATDLRDDQESEVRRCLYELTAELKRLSLRVEMGAVCEEEPHLRSLYRELIDQEMERSLALELVQTVAEELSSRAKGDYRIVRERALAHLSRLYACRDGAAAARAGSPAFVFLAGPTGVGKTTTIAKLAAQHSIMQGRKVLLVNADSYRVGAEAQLQIFADIMRLPMVTVRSPQDLERVCQERRDVEIVLVDTAGRSQRNHEALAETKAIVAAAPADGREVHLVVSASTRLSELNDIVESFACLSVDYLLATKLDEAMHFGPLVSLAARRGKPFSYFTTGQHVPEDLEAACPSRLAESILKGY